MNRATSLARPGGNITGTTQMAVDIVPKRLELFKEAIPGLQRVALLINSSDPVIARRSLDEVQAAANRLNIDILPVDVRARDEIEAAFRAIDQMRVDGVFTVVDPMLYDSRKQIAELALARRLPTMLHVGEMTEDGGLMSYAADYPALFRRTAAYVDKIVRGANPADLPVEQPTQFEFVVNLRTAAAIGLTVPPMLLARASRVIE